MSAGWDLSELMGKAGAEQQILDPDLERKAEAAAIEIAWKMSGNHDYPAIREAGRNYLIEHGILGQTSSQAH